MNLLSRLAIQGLGRVAAIPAGPRLSILIFHRVMAHPDPLLPDEPDAAMFEARMRSLATAFHVMPLIEATRRMHAGSLPMNAACITFDDGYADNLLVAAPILARMRIQATFFIASGFLDGGRMWNDTVIETIRLHPERVLDLSALGLGVWPTATELERVASISGLLNQLKYLPQAERQQKVDAMGALVGLPEHSDLMMTRQQVRELRRYGMSIGAHTRTHPILTALSSHEARTEIDDGRRDLEDIIGERVKLFAYPNGKPGRDYDRSHVAMARELGFEAAVSTAWGVSTRFTDRFQLPRFTPWDLDIDRFGRRLAQNLFRSPELAPA